MTNQWKRLLSGLLALAMTFSLFVPAMATSVEDETEDDSSVVADVAEDTAEDAEAEETADDSQPTEDVSEDAEAEETVEPEEAEESAEPEETEEADEPADDEGSDTTSYPVSASYVADGTTVTITVSLDEGATTGNGKVTLTYSADLYTVDSTTAGSGVVLPDFNTDTAGTVSYGWVALSLSGPADLATIVLTASGEASVSDFSLVLNEYGTDSPEVSIALSSSSEEPGTGEGDEEAPTAYTITLDANGGTVEPSTLTVTTGSTLSDLPTPTREGYQFDGWFDADGTEYTTETVYELESDLTLTAQWSAYVAQIGETQYTTLADAFAAAVDGDTVELLADVTLDSAVAISTDISVSLTSAGNNTYTITRSGRSMRMLYVTKATLTLSNVTLDGAYSEIDTNTYSMVEVASGGTVIMNDGVTMQNAVCSYQARGGAVTVSGSGTFTMNGGTVTGCGSSKSSGSTTSAGSNPGGAICVYGGSSTSLTATTTFTMNGGTIENCFGLRGGAVYVGNAATKVTVQFIMNGGTIKNCVAATSLDGSVTGYGGAIFVMGKGSSGVSVPTVYINGGEITGCKADKYGGALGTIAGGSSTTGSYYAGAYVIMGGYIHDNVSGNGNPSSGYGNGIFVVADRGNRAVAMTLGGDARIEDNIYLENYATMNVVDNFTGYAKVYTAYITDAVEKDGVRVVAYAVDADGNTSTATGTIAARLLEVYSALNDDGEVYADPRYTIAVDPDDDTRYIIGAPITVTYTDGVEDEEVFADQTFTVIAGNVTPTIEDPTRTGYTFAGWTPELAETVTEDVTYTATWTINSYTVTYTDGVDDEELFADQSYTVEYGSATPAYEGETPTRSGYTFAGWEPEVAETVTGDVTYTAQWEPITYTVTYTDGVEDEIVFEDQVYTVNEGGETPAFDGTPTRTNYNFTGWEPEVSDTVTADVTYVAQWEPSTDNKPADSKKPTATTIKSMQIRAYFIGTDAFSTTGELLSLSPSDYRANTVAYEIGDIYGNDVDGYYIDITFTFQHGDEFEVGAADTFNTSTSYEKAYADYMPDWTGNWEYDFDYADGYGQVQVLTLKWGGSAWKSLSTSTGEYTGNLTSNINNLIKAYLTLPRYTVTYTDGVEDVELFADQVTTGVASGAATPAYEGETPARSGYTFAGWEPEVAETVSADTTYVATWTANTYTVTLDPGEGNSVDPTTLEATYDSAIGELPTPVSSDVTVYFAGWYDAEGNLVTSETVYTTAGDSTLTAKWSDCVARVESTGVYYATLQDALDAVKESLADLGDTQTETVTLVADTVECVKLSWGSSAKTSLDLTIDLNGHTVDGNSEGTVMAFSRLTSYTFTISVSIADSVGTGVITGGSGSSGGAISLTSFKSGDSLNIKGGTISGNTASSTGGAIYTSVAGVTINVSGGAITGNTAKNGGAISARTVNVTGGVITGNSASASGGGIYAYGSNGVAKVTISGGQVYGNTADTAGDDIYYYTKTNSSSLTSGLTLIAASEMGVEGVYGWYNDKSGSRYSEDNCSEFTTLTFTDKTTTVALKAASGYATVTYADEDGTVLQSTKLANGSATPAYEGETPTKTNYVFAGWVDAEGNAPAETVLGDVTYTPTWTGVTVTLTLNGNGATLETTTVEATYDAAYPELPTPTLKGFSGEGWYIVNEDGTYTAITSDTVVTNPNDHELIYLWSVADFSVTLTSGYKSNKWSLSWSTSLEPFNLTAKVTAIDGLTYSYQWYKDDEAIEGATDSTLTINGNVRESGVYKVVVTATLADGSDIVVVNASATAEAQNTLKITRVANTLYYNANGGTDGPSNNFANLDTVTVQTKVPTREGYTFVGWNTEADGSGDSYVGGDSYDFSKYYDDVDTLANGGLKAYLYAQWSANSYTLTLDAGDGSVDPESVTVTYDSAIGELPVATRNGYTFLGWFDENGDEVIADTVYTTVGNSTVTAQWSANSYTLTLDAGNGSVDPESITVTYDSAIGELPVATPADGYTFEGWCDEDGNEVTAETVYTTAGDSTIVAQYSTLDVPVLVSATNGLTGITVTWEAVDGAVQYQVLRRISTSSPWTAWEVVTVTSDTSYLDTDVTTGEIYRYTVACVAADGVTRTSLYNTSGVAVRWVAPTTAKAANQASGIQVTWTKVEGADGYMIYRKTANGSYKWIATIRDVDTLSYLDKNVSSGTDYTYSVRAFVSSTQSAYTVVGLWRLSEPELTLTTSTGSVTLSWNKVTGAEGYYVYRRTAGGAFERIATISSGSTVKFTDTTAVSGVHYYYAVRAYKSYTGSSYTAVDIVCK